MTLVYDAENHQTKLFLGANNSETPDAVYQYDGEGRRVVKISAHEKTVFVYDGGGQLVAEYTAFLAGDPAPTPQVSYLTQDHLGSTRVITNNLGQVIKRSDYMAYGDEVITANRSSANGYEQPSETRKGYTGYERDIESGLDFAQARYYNPQHGRFTSVDPLTASANVKDPQTFNRYTYALNSPYKFTDPLGLISSSTGACGSWCQNSGPNANEVDGTYVWFSDPHADRRDLIKELLRRHLARLQNREPRLIDEIEGTIQTSIATRELPTPAQGQDEGVQATQSLSDRVAAGVARRLTLTFTGVFGEIVLNSETRLYNCLAWGLDFADRWIQTQTGNTYGRGDIGEWNNPASRNSSRVIRGDFKFSGTQGSQAVASAYGGQVYTGGWIPPGFHIMRVFEDPRNLTESHVMRRESDGTWSSKNGPSFRYTGITHPNLFARIHYRDLFAGGNVTITDFLVLNRR